jgi:hypothetical protein
MSWVTAISSPVPAPSPILITSALPPPPPITDLTTQQRNIIRLTNSFKLSKESNHGGANQKTLGEKRATT